METRSGMARASVLSNLVCTASHILCINAVELPPAAKVVSLILLCSPAHTPGCITDDAAHSRLDAPGRGIPSERRLRTNAGCGHPLGPILGAGGGFTYTARVVRGAADGTQGESQKWPEPFRVNTYWNSWYLKIFHNEMGAMLIVSIKYKSSKYYGAFNIMARVWFISIQSALQHIDLKILGVQ